MENQQKPRILCLHGRGSSAKILENEMKIWPDFVLEMDSVYIDAPFLTDQSIHIDPPFYYWFDVAKINETFDETIAYVEEQMIKLGPFDAVLGASEGGVVTAALPGMQRQGVALTKVPRIKFVVLILGAKVGGLMFPCPDISKNVFSSPVDIPSLHIVGEQDRNKKWQFELLEAFVRPTLLYHHEGQGPHLDDNGVKTVLEFLSRIRGIVHHIQRRRSRIDSLFCLNPLNRRIPNFNKPNLSQLGYDYYGFKSKGNRENVLETQLQKKPRILCLHGHGGSAKILEIEMKRWPEFVLEKMDLVYIDAPFVIDPCGYASEYDPPYYEWYNFEDDKSFEEAVAYIEEQMIKLGPFDGVLGLSQGGAVTGTLPGMQRQGVAMTKVPRIKFVIIISGPKLGGSMLPCPELAQHAFSSPIDIPSLHTIGDKEKTKVGLFELLESFVNPTLLYHREGHGVPHLDENGVKIVLGFLKEIGRIILRKKDSLEGGRNRMCCFCFDLIASLFCLRKNKSFILKNRARVQSLS